MVLCDLKCVGVGEPKGVVVGPLVGLVFVVIVINVKVEKILIIVVVVGSQVVPHVPRMAQTISRYAAVVVSGVIDHILRQSWGGNGYVCVHF